MNTSVLRWLLPALFALGPALAGAQAIVDTTFVEQAAARGAILWDVRSEEDYNKGHVPGAINFDDPLAQLREGRTEDYLPIPQMERILGEAGLDPAREIVVYGAKAAPSAYFAYQTLAYLGAGRLHVYHGGIDDWKAAGKPVGTERTRLPATRFEADNVRKDLLIGTGDVAARLHRSGVQIVDARTAREYSGEDLRALRGGHIPGAVNIPYEQNWVDPETPRKLMRRLVDNKDGMALKSTEALQQLYAALDPGKETIVYCQSGVRAAVTASVLQDLGFKQVKIYDGSWLAYGNTFEAPVENVTYFNVGRVNGMLNQLQGRIDALEAELQQMRSVRDAAAKQP